MAKIHPIRTGSVQVRHAQMVSKGQGIARVVNMLTDPLWTDWLPIYAWAIETDRGVVLVDTGESARVHTPGYLPTWHPFYQRATHFRVTPEDELGPQLRRLGIHSGDIRAVVLTHLHTDHAGGLQHVVGCPIWVHSAELARASGWLGRLNGYLPHRWPRWLQPRQFKFVDRTIGPFARSAEVGVGEEVLVLPTPGHTPSHVSVLVQGSPAVLLAGDTSYTQQNLVDEKIDGVSPNPEVSRQTLRRIRELALQQPLVYLPTHDADCENRLSKLSLL